MLEDSNTEWGKASMRQMGRFGFEEGQQRPLTAANRLHFSNIHPFPTCWEIWRLQISLARVPLNHPLHRDFNHRAILQPHVSIL